MCLHLWSSEKPRCSSATTKTREGTHTHTHTHTHKHTHTHTRTTQQLGTLHRIPLAATPNIKGTIDSYFSAFLCFSFSLPHSTGKLQVFAHNSEFCFWAFLLIRGLKKSIHFKVNVKRHY